MEVVVAYKLYGVIRANVLFFILVIDINGTPFAISFCVLGTNVGASPDKDIEEMCFEVRIKTRFSNSKRKKWIRKIIFK